MGSGAIPGETAEITRSETTPAIDGESSFERMGRSNSLTVSKALL